MHAHKRDPTLRGILFLSTVLDWYPSYTRVILKPPPPCYIFVWPIIEFACEPSAVGRSHSMCTLYTGTANTTMEVKDGSTWPPTDPCTCSCAIAESVRT